MRSTLLASVLIVTAGLAAAGDWPQFLGPTRNGVAPPSKVKLAESWPEDGPKELWKLEVGPGFGGPAVRDGQVYLLDRAETEDVLRCLDLASGQELWRYAYEAPGKKFGNHGSRSTPAVDDKHVFTLGLYGHLHCISRATHKPVWSKQVLSDYQGKLPSWGVAISPLLYKDWVIVATLGRSAGVVAYEKASGKEAWRSRAVGPMAYVSPVLFRAGGTEQLVVLTDGGSRVAGLSAADGTLLWTYRNWKCNIPIAAPTDCGGGRLFVTGGYKAGSVMLQVKKASETFQVEELFRLDDQGSILHNAVLHDGHVYVNANTKRTFDGLMCVDLTGRVKWQTGKDPNCEKGNLILAGDLIYILDGRTGVLRLVRATPEKYTELAQAKVFRPKAPVWAPMALVDGKLLCRDQAELKCLDVSAGGS